MIRSLAVTVLAAVLAAGCGRKDEAPAPAPPAPTTGALAAWSVQKASELGSVACSLAPSQWALFRYLETSFASAAGGAEAVASALSLRAVRHSSGAYIFTGSSGYVAKSMGAASLSAGLVKVAVGAAATAIVLELVCVKTNHPAFVALLDAAATNFYHRGLDAAKTSVKSASRKLGPPLQEAQRLVLREVADAFEQASGATVEVTDAVLRQLK